MTVNSAYAADYALRVEAPPECADEARLLDAVRVRSPGFTPAQWDTPGATRFVVRFLSHDTGVTVELETTDPSGANSLRRVPAQDCSEAIRASAWILTLLVDPTAAAASGPAPLETRPLNETIEPIVPATAATEGQPAPQVPPKPPPAQAAAAPVAQANTPEKVDSPPPEESVAPSEPWRWDISLGGFGGVLQTALPGTPLGFGVFVEWAGERESWFRPAARLAGLYAGSGVGHTDRGDVTVSLVSARLSLCPLRTSREYLVSARFCALGELGGLRGDGHETDAKGSAAPPWYAAGPALGIELQPWSSLALELEAALIFPFNRDRFVFEPDPVQVGYEVPPISGSIALGAAWRF